MIKNNEYFIIGIDGGASNTRGILINEKGETLATAFDKGTNLAVYGETAAERIINISTGLMMRMDLLLSKARMMVSFTMG